MTRAPLILSLIATLGVPAAAQTAASPYGADDWLLETVDGAAVTYEARLNLAEPGRAAGRAPCNAYFSALTGDMPALSFGPIGATRMMCPDIDAETAYFGLLEQVQAATLADDLLTLSGGDHVLTFARIK
ncbi:MAG: META domain-containing protein [Paracoccaceae bacterium]